MGPGKLWDMKHQQYGTNLVSQLPGSDSLDNPGDREVITEN